MSLVALCAFRDAEEWLPGWFDALHGLVDGAILLDDSSQDGSVRCCEANPLTLKIIRRFERHAAHYREIENRETLLREALKFGAARVLCLDADERVETNFFRLIRGVDTDTVFSLRVRDPWNSLTRYRVDGIWNQKRKFVCFPCVEFKQYFLPQSLHARWPPPCLNSNPKEETEFNLYHLGSLTPELRQKRVAKFLKVDLANSAQYLYLNDESGAIFVDIPEDRRWQETKKPAPPGAGNDDYPS
jgi:hypothetical protein